MAGIEIVKVRAEINIGGGNLVAGTPPLGHNNHILSFNVDKARGQISSFSASLKIRRDEISGGLLDDASVTIYAGTADNYSNTDHRIFTGSIKTATVTPNRDDPEYVILNISGNDVLSKLNGKKYTRRCRSSKGVWVSIDNVSRTGLRDSRLTYEPSGSNISVWGGALYKEDNRTSTRVPITDENVEKVDNDYVKSDIVLDVRPAEVQ